MDRDTVRMILLVIGVIVIAGVYIWGRYKEQLLDFLNREGEFDELEFDEQFGETSAGPDDFEITVLDRSAKKAPEPQVLAEGDDEEDFGLGHETAAPVPVAREEPRTAPLGAPFLIQLSVVASDDGFFNGEDLRDALVELDLIYGDMGIYHRYDREYREPLFSIASLVEPGTFPIEDMESFECPGVVLFFQPTQVKAPLEVFDDLVSTCHELAVKLDGVEWDETHKPLTQEKIALMRQRLEAAY